MAITRSILCCLIAFASFLSIQQSFAQNNATIVDHISTNSNCTITQPEALNIRLQKIVEITDTVTSIATEKHIAGYRVQVFSDNNSRTAKREARNKARNVSEKFPEYRTYVIYNSPFWRLRVGDFRTYEEASEAALLIKEEFPTYSREIRVVRDRINNTNQD